MESRVLEIVLSRKPRPSGLGRIPSPRSASLPHRPRHGGACIRV